MKRRSLLTAAGLACLAPLAARAAEPFPARPVRIIVPYAAGGGPDVFTRRMAIPLGQALGQSIVVENKVGAAGVLAAQYVAAAPADGYTLLQGSVTHLIQKILQPGLKFDPVADFTPIGNVSMAPSVLVVAASSPYQSAQELIKAIQAAPGKMNYGSGGIGTTAHLAGATLVALAGVQAVHIPLRGSVEIAGSLLRGDTQFAFPTASTAVPQVQGGKLRALAVTSAQPLSQLPGVPTLRQVLGGNPLAVQEAWSGLWAPAGTPADVVQRVFSTLGEALQSSDVRAAVAASGSELAPSPSPQAYAQFVRSELAKWTEIVRTVGVTVN